MIKLTTCFSFSISIERKKKELSTTISKVKKVEDSVMSKRLLREALSKSG